MPEEYIMRGGRVVGKLRTDGSILILKRTPHYEPGMGWGTLSEWKEVNSMLPQMVETGMFGPCTGVIGLTVIVIGLLLAGISGSLLIYYNKKIKDLEEAQKRRP